MNLAQSLRLPPKRIIRKLSRFSYLQPKRRWLSYGLLPFAMGCLSALAFAPLFLFSILFFTLTWLVLRLDHEKSPWSALLVGWVFGLGLSLVGTYWVGESFLVEGGTVALLMPIALISLTSYLAIFPALSCFVAKLFWSNSRLRFLTLALAWSFFEFVRGHFGFGGFPWNLLGSSLGFSLALLQNDAWMGPYGLSLITLILCTFPSFFIRTKHLPTWREGLLDFVQGMLIGATALVALGFVGTVRFRHANHTIVPDTLIEIVQPNISRTMSQDPTKKDEILQRLKTMTSFSILKAKHNLIVWPEGALPLTFINQTPPPRLESFIRTLPPNVTLLANAIRVDTRRNKIFNSLFSLTQETSMRSSNFYDKRKLVPFGEYLPLKHILQALGLRKFIDTRGSFAAGEGVKTLHLQGFPALSPLICYEIIFAHNIINPLDPPSWILNVTDDGWFGKTSGPYQHLLQDQMRAIEQGLPVIRAATTGISAVINPYGFIETKLALDTQGTLFAHLPEKISPPPYARYGDKLFGFLWLLVLFVFLLCTFLERKKRDAQKIFSR